MEEGHRCYFQVVNWDKFQHYKDRNPPWIKFYAELLEDPGVAALPDATKAHLFGIWLLASRLQNRIPNDPAFIARRINATVKVDLKTLMRFSFIEPIAECLHDASNPLASCATPLSGLYLETETEQRQRRTETETDGASAGKSKRRSVQKPETDDDPELRAYVDAYNTILGGRITYSPGNLRASARCKAAGYDVEHVKTVFQAVKERATLTADWCHANNREFEYLIRPAYKHNRSQELIYGPLDKIPNELATGRKAG